MVSQVDSQLSLDGGIVILVLGEMSNKGDASHKFAQTIVLAEQPNGYYVLNDIFRYLKEDIDAHGSTAYDDPSAVSAAAIASATVPTAVAPVVEQPAPVP